MTAGARPLAELEELLGQLLVVVYDERKPTPKRLAAAQAWWEVARELCSTDQAAPGFVSRSIVEVGLAMCAWRSGQPARPENPPKWVRERLERARSL